MADKRDILIQATEGGAYGAGKVKRFGLSLWWASKFVTSCAFISTTWQRNSLRAKPLTLIL